MKKKNAPRSKHEITLESHGGDRGDLYVGEVGKHIPFIIQRFYIFTNVPPDSVRGAHAHKRTEQAVFCLNGSFQLLIDDGTTKKTQRIDTLSKGMLLPSRVWHALSDFSKDCVALVVASEPYDETDYIRDYQEFLNYIR